MATPVRSAAPEPVTAAVVLAAGQGQRFGRAKQFEQIGDATLVDRVVTTAQSVCDYIVLVLPTDYETEPGTTETAWGNGPIHAVVRGGRSHGESARIGLDQVPHSVGIVLLASASHPLAGPNLFRRTIRAVADGADAAAPLGVLADAIKEHHDRRIVRSVAKARLALAQSPCAFNRKLLDRAYSELTTPGQTLPPEEMEMIERLGGDMVFVEGEPTNIHVTTPLELEMARRIAELVPDAIILDGNSQGANTRAGRSDAVGA